MSLWQLSNSWTQKLRGLNTGNFYYLDMKKIMVWIYRCFLFAVFSLIVCSCEKEDDLGKQPQGIVRGDTFRVQLDDQEGFFIHLDTMRAVGIGNEFFFYDYYNFFRLINYHGTLVIPSWVESEGVKYQVVAINYGAFYNCQDLTQVVIPNSVREIGSGAFDKCVGLTSVKLPKGISRIEYSTFSFCMALSALEIPASVKEIQDLAFYNCQKLNSIQIPEGVTKLGSEAFSHCYGLTTIYIPGSITDMGNNVFRECKRLTSVKIANGVEKLGVCVFAGCTGLTSVILPESLTQIGLGAFAYCKSLTTIKLPNGLTEIPKEAFHGSGLTSVIIPATVSSIGEYAFEGCLEMKTFHIQRLIPPSTESSAFPAQLDTLFVPQAAVIQYESTYPWSCYTIIGE